MALTKTNKRIRRDFSGSIEKTIASKNVANEMVLNKNSTNENIENNDSVSVEEISTNENIIDEAKNNINESVEMINTVQTPIEKSASAGYRRPGRPKKEDYTRVTLSVPNTIYNLVKPAAFLTSGGNVTEYIVSLIEKDITNNKAKYDAIANFIQENK